MLVEGVEVDTERLLGTGGFADVFAGIFRGDLVAIKRLRSPYPNKSPSTVALRRVRVAFEVETHLTYFHPGSVSGGGSVVQLGS